MRQALWPILLIVFGIPGAAFGQATSSDSQTLQSLLTEVRELRRELRISLARVQVAQILLSRLQIQQAIVTRASERLNDTRSKLAGTEDHQKHVVADIKLLEETLNAEGDPAQQKALQDRISHSKSDLEAATGEQQQRQAAEIEAEQQLRSEQDKLSTLETELDELVKSMGRTTEQSEHAPR